MESAKAPGTMHVYCGVLWDRYLTSSITGNLGRARNHVGSSTAVLELLQYNSSDPAKWRMDIQGYGVVGTFAAARGLIFLRTIYSQHANKLGCNSRITANCL